MAKTRFLRMQMGDWFQNTEIKTSWLQSLRFQFQTNSNKLPLLAQKHKKYQLQFAHKY